MGATTAQRVSRFAGTIEVEDDSGTTTEYRVRKINGDQWEALVKASVRDPAVGPPSPAELDATTRRILGDLVVGVTPDQFGQWPAEAQVLALQMATASVRELTDLLGKGVAAPVAATS